MSDKAKEGQHCEVTGACTLLMGLGRLTVIWKTVLDFLVK